MSNTQLQGIIHMLYQQIDDMASQMELHRKEVGKLQVMIYKDCNHTMEAVSYTTYDTIRQCVKCGMTE